MTSRVVAGNDFGFVEANVTPIGAPHSEDIAGVLNTVAAR